MLLQLLEKELNLPPVVVKISNQHWVDIQRVSEEDGGGQSNQWIDSPFSAISFGVLTRLSINRADRLLSIQSFRVKPVRR